MGPCVRRDDSGSRCCTIISNARSHSRDALRPRLPRNFPPSIQRAQGRPGARCTRGLVCNVHKECAHERTGQRRTPSLPCAMALRLMARSPRSGRARCHRGPSEALASSELDASIRGKSGPHAFAVRLCRARQAATSASIASPSHVRDDRERPSGRDGMDINVN